MPDETFRITDENRAAALQIALAVAKLKDVDATIPARLAQLDQDYQARRQQLEQDGRVARQTRLDALRAAVTGLIGEHPPDVWITIADDGQNYTVHRPGPQLEAVAPPPTKGALRKAHRAQTKEKAP